MIKVQIYSCTLKNATVDAVIDHNFYNYSNYNELFFHLVPLSDSKEPKSEYM